MYIYTKIVIVNDLSIHRINNKYLDILPKKIIKSNFMQQNFLKIYPSDLSPPKPSPC